MTLIAEQPYIKVERKVSGTSLEKQAEQRSLYLYDDKIVTSYHEFRIENVWDMSYRIIGGEGGMLYLHTNTGVNVYTVKSSPESFIEAFRQLKQTN